MRRRRSASCSSGTLTRKERIAASSVAAVAFSGNKLIAAAAATPMTAKPTRRRRSQSMSSDAVSMAKLSGRKIAKARLHPPRADERRLNEKRSCHRGPRATMKAQHTFVCFTTLKFCAAVGAGNFAQQREAMLPQKSQSRHSRLECWLGRRDWPVTDKWLDGGCK